MEKAVREDLLEYGPGAGLRQLPPGLGVGIEIRYLGAGYPLDNKAAAGRELLPLTVLEKAPSAELRPDQMDTDTLPPYEQLDPVLGAYVEEDKSVEQIVTMGYDEEMVKGAVRLVDISEYKRRQAPPGIKITPRAFGRDRRLPITNRFKGW